MIQATPTEFSEMIPYVMNSSLPRWPDRFLWQAVPEAGAYLGHAVSHCLGPSAGRRYQYPYRRQ